MRLQTLKYSLIVFIAGSSYGAMASTVKLAYAEGYNWTQTVASQACFGTFIFAIVFLAALIAKRKPQPMGAKQALRLIGTGIVACSTTVLYGLSLTTLPAAVSITLMFQFTWIGIVIQVITTRRKPHNAEVVAALIIFGGTLFASGILPGGYYQDLDPFGIICASLSAVTCALFMFLSGKVETGIPPIQRGLLICCGASILGLIVCPDYFTSGVIIEGIWKYGLVLGLFGLFIPVILFGIATPHLPAGIATIMASSELPCAILISVFILQEAIDRFQIFGVVAILGGVVVSQLPYIRFARSLAAQTRSPAAQQDVRIADPSKSAPREGGSLDEVGDSGQIGALGDDGILDGADAFGEGGIPMEDGSFVDVENP